MQVEDASSPPANLRRRGLFRALFVAKLFVSVGLLALLYHWIDVGILIDEFAHLHWGWLVGGVAILQTQTLLSTVKWSMILRGDGSHVPFLILWRTYLISGFLSLFLPSGFGGDVYRVWALNQRNIKVGKGTASVLFDRLTGVFALVTIGIAGALFLIGVQFAIVIVVGYVLGIAAFLIVTSNSMLPRLPEGGSKYLDFFVGLVRSANAYRRSSRRLLTMLALSFVFQFNIVLVVVCYARALRIPAVDISFSEFVAMVPVVYVTELLPITINGIGVRDGAFVFFFTRLGGIAEQALALALLIVAIRYISGLVGGALLLRTILERRQAPAKSDADARLGAAQGGGS